MVLSNVIVFNSLLGVSSGDETLHLMFDILLYKLRTNVNQRRANDLLTRSSKTNYERMTI